MFRAIFLLNHLPTLGLGGVIHCSILCLLVAQALPILRVLGEVLIVHDSILA